MNSTTINFKLFRHKWKIISLTLIGLGGAIYFYFTNTPPWQSEAKILIRYVADREKMQPDQSGTRIMSPDIGHNVIYSEMEILTSFDLAAEVATNIGPEKILAKLGGGNSPIAAAAVIEGGLRVDVWTNSSVVHVFFRHPDPNIVQPVLTQLINVYLEKHALVHSDVGASDDFLMAQISQLTQQLQDTDDNLRFTKTNAGIVSVEDSQKFYSSELSTVQQEIFQLEEQLDENQVQAQALKSAGQLNLLSTNNSTQLGTNNAVPWSSIPTRLRFLNFKKSELQADAANLEVTANKISGLERQKQMYEANLEYWQKEQQQKRLAVEMGSEGVANIQRIQHPSPPYKDFRKFYKTIWLMIFGGLVFGLIWAFISECCLYFSVKRAVNIKI
jgi:uncharacterized protein involved in exopolysaccharide biosynthesis